MLPAETTADPEPSAGLRDTRKLLQDVIDGVPALVFIKDCEDRYVLINRLTAELYGEAVGRTDDEITSREEAQQFVANDMEVLRSGEAREFEEWTLLGGELRTFYSLKFPLFDRDGRPYAVCGVSTDITALKRAESEARDARNEAERANRAKSEFLSHISHELRTPLHSILGYSQLLQMQQLTPDVRRTAARIASAGNHLLGLIDDLLDLSRIEQGVDRMSIEPVYVCTAVRDAAEIMRPIAATRGIEVDLDLHGGLHRFVAADRRRLQQVLLNLMTNAVNYNRPGGEVRVSCRDGSDGRMRFLVTDTGPGIEAADLERVFLPFERAGAEEERPDGAGLGLAVSRILIEGMRGRVGIERSVPGEGTTFFVELELVAPPENAHELVFGTAPPAQDDAPPLDGRILYVEDSPANVELLELALRDAGDVTLVTETRGEAGLRRAAELGPDLILLDLSLPDMPGARVLEQLKGDPRTREIPVLVVSADATQRQIERIRAAGAFDYLTKPLDLVELLRVMRAALERSRGATPR